MRQKIDTYDEDTAEFLAHFSNYVVENYGRPCKEFNAGCHTCRMWDYYGEIRKIVDLTEAAMGKKHPGFKKAETSIAKREGVSKRAAGAILASSARGASAQAKKTNPRLKRVK